MDNVILVACEPGAIAAPHDLTPEVLASGVPLDSLGVVAAVPDWRVLAGPGRSVDDLDWWMVADVTVAERSRIVFDGLTFPGTVFVDDADVAVVESMFLPVGVTIEPGSHRIALRFESLTRWLATRRPRGRWRSSMVAAQGLRWARTTLLGRAPVFTVAQPPIGVWRAFRVDAGPVIEELEVHADPHSGRVSVSGRCVDAVGDPVADAVIGAHLRAPDGSLVEQPTTTASDGTFATHLDIEDPQIWWPNGYGAQPLYRLTVSVAGHTVDRVVGFRSIESEVSDGGFVVTVNAVAIFCRGAVWTPVDPIAMRADPERLRERLARLADAGATMVRVPGGLVFEQPEFWSICAELGLLVWQDAMIATFDPPAELDDIVARELRTVLGANAGNPALAVVSGGSETIQQPVMLGLPAQVRTIDLVERVLAGVATDAGVPYVESSPSAPTGSGDFPLRADTGISHWFGVGGYRRPIADVRTAGVRFAAESLAFSIPPAPSAVDRHFRSAAMAGHDPGWKVAVPRDRGSSWDFEDVRDRYVTDVFDIDNLELRARDPERYLQLGRIAVAQAMSACFVHWRTDARCGGALVLTASDLAVGAGWGLFDVDGAPKLPLDMLTRAWAPVALLLSDAAMDGVRIHVVNDGPAPIVGELRVCATADGGAVVAEGSRAVEIAARGSHVVLDSEVTGVFRDLSDAYRFGPRIADAVEATLVVDGVVVRREVLPIRPGPPASSTGTPRAVVRRDGPSWHVELTGPVTLRWVEIDCPGWTPADNVFHLAAGLPYRVALAPDTPADTAPRGRVTTPDHPTPITIEVIE